MEEKNGIVDCFSSFHGAYCVRKISEFSVSLLTLICTLSIIGLMAHSHGWRNKWAFIILTLISLGLISNIIFCFLNTQYKLFALETYFYNLYYLAVVGYVCQSYLLKPRLKLVRGCYSSSSSSAPLIASETSSSKLSIFYAVLTIFGLLDTAIFITSLINEKEADNNADASNQYMKDTCEEIWYLCVNAVCIFLSIIVVAVLFKNQQEELEGMGKYKLDTIQVQSEPNPSSISPVQLHNPLRNIWIWITINVIAQIINLVESGLFLTTNPEQQCRIVPSNAILNEYVLLLFVVLTMWSSYIATLWYFNLIRKQNNFIVDRSKHFSEEINMTGNIELFLPSDESIKAG